MRTEGFVNFNNEILLFWQIKKDIFGCFTA